MKYYLDCEFDGFDGPIMSLGLVCEDGCGLYMLFNHEAKDEWVKKNVSPLLHASVPTGVDVVYSASVDTAPYHLKRFFGDDYSIHVIADWPDDIKYLTRLLLLGPGKMIDIVSISFEVVRVDAYPTELPGAVQHNAYWDARALRYYLTNDHYQPEFDL